MLNQQPRQLGTGSRTQVIETTSNNNNSNNNNNNVLRLRPTADEQQHEEDEPVSVLRNQQESILQWKK